MNPKPYVKHKNSNFYRQGEYVPINKGKYCGKFPIHYRSGWEYKVCLWLDKNTSVEKWGIESAIVPYLDPVTKRMKRYVIDFTAIIRDRDGNLTRYYIEVKPHHETVAPVRGRKRESTYISEALTFARNSAKWKSATEFAKSKGGKFIIITEKEMQM